MNTARLTPAFASDCCGCIHSVFESAVNAGMRMPEGMRLLTLTTPCAPRLPDSLRAEQRVLDACKPGAAVALIGDCLHIGTLRVPFTREDCPPLTALAGRPRTAEFLAEAAALSTGFDRLPDALRARCTRALTTPDAPRFIGLGLGLTPSYDDACVGVLAAYRALGRKAPFVLSAFGATTDVSARYLRLAQEGYFGEPLTQLLSALFGQDSIQDALGHLLNVGATSGADMAYGVAAALRQTKHESSAADAR